MTDADQPAAQDATAAPAENQIIAGRRAKLDALREKGNAFPNQFRRDTLAEHLHGSFG